MEVSRAFGQGRPTATGLFRWAIGWLAITFAVASLACQLWAPRKSKSSLPSQPRCLLPAAYTHLHLVHSEVIYISLCSSRSQPQSSSEQLPRLKLRRPPIFHHSRSHLRLIRHLFTNRQPLCRFLLSCEHTSYHWLCHPSILVLPLQTSEHLPRLRFKVRNRPRQASDRPT